MQLFPRLPKCPQVNGVYSGQCPQVVMNTSAYTHTHTHTTSPSHRFLWLRQGIKKGQKYDPANYRPISLTCITSKLMEHIICSSVMSFATANNIFYALQHGFRSKRSCESQLLEFIQDVSTNMQNGLQTDVCVLDFSKAFDKIGHTRLIEKLKWYGITGSTNNWIKSFLSNRTQAVVLDGVSSSSIHVSSGVPQGSVLGPCLFLFYINDIAQDPHSTTRLFADDDLYGD